MNQITTTFSDSFSWQRVCMVGRYYYPALRTQVILYPLISMAIGIISFFMFYLLGKTGVSAILLYGLLFFVLTMMYYWSPGVFAHNSCQAIETILPARSSEKATFILLYALIGVSILTWVPQFVCISLLEWIFDVSVDFVSTKKVDVTSIGSGFYWTNIFQYLVPLTTCLFVVMKRTTSRLGRGIVWSIVSLIGLSIGAFVSVIIICIGSVSSESEIMERLPEITESLIINTGVVSLVYSAIMVCLTVRAINKIQI